MPHHGRSLRFNPSGRRMSGGNGICPSTMTADARLAELGRILAAGVLRLREQSSSISDQYGDSSLGSPASKSVSRPRARARNGGR